MRIEYLRPMVIDRFDFPLWQWFVYALCAVIVTTAMLLLILLVGYTVLHIATVLEHNTLNTSNESC